MKETFLLPIYVHCYALRVNLALEGSLSLVPNLKNALGISQSLYDFIGESSKRVASFNMRENCCLYWKNRSANLDGRVDMK